MSEVGLLESVSEIAEVSQQASRPETTLKREVRTALKTHVYKILSASLLFVTALAWNKTFSQFFESIPYLKKKSALVYSIFITILAVGIVRLYSMYSDDSASD